MSDPDISGARECNRAEEISDFIDEEHAGPLTGTIDHSPPRRDRIVTDFPGGEDNRDAGSYRPMADDQLAVSGYQCRLTHLDTRYVRDGIVGSRRAVEGHPQIAPPC